MTSEERRKGGRAAAYEAGIDPSPKQILARAKQIRKERKSRPGAELVSRLLCDREPVVHTLHLKGF